MKTKNEFKTYTPKTQKEFIECMGKAKRGDIIIMTGAIKNEREKAKKKTITTNKNIFCQHPGCRLHISHPCEGCGRQWNKA